ncbi:LrgB family protein [Anaeromicropila populeti]|uniref:TIGR00659 family protein n=1 Tax=Anaeromicropila populeti TaxID=37658 RepID=A0A1I6JWE7_9FIRM|nr:LrgB family protein [Anaeromicropila populeti]SFR83218.1 TIGR00659 family protein [Anaeromicropila populeti]
MNSLTASPLFGILLSISAFLLGSALNRKTKSPLVNPLLVAISFIIIILHSFHIPLENYQQGGNMISLFLAPATTVLGYSVYKQIEILKKYFIPVAAGCFVGSLTSMGSIYLLCHLFHLDSTLTFSLIPKSVTTPIAMEVSSQLSGIPSITVAAVVATGILGSVTAPILVKIFRIQNPVAAGTAIGTCSHAVGTSKAIELGEIQGAMSGIAIGMSGIITVLLALFF